MQNDVLKNNIAPWQEKGRWYHGVIDYTLNPVNYIQDKSDKYLVDNCTIGASAGNVVLLPKFPKIKILDVHLKQLNATRTSSGSVNNVYYIYTDGRLAYSLGPANMDSGTCEFWAFIVKE